MSTLVKTTLSEQIYTILREDIINQTIKCGEKLTLKSLQNRFNVSSTPVREAMNRLSQEGLLDHVTNVGAKVVELKEKDIEEIYDFCSVLDVTALRLSLASKNLKEITVKLKLCLELQEQASASGNIKDFMKHSDDFHDIFFQYADNSRLYDASLRIRSQFSILTTKYQNYTITKSNVLKEHKNIADTIFAKDFNRAELLMIQHFEHAKTYLLSNIRFHHDTRDDKP